MKKNMKCLNCDWLVRYGAHNYCLIKREEVENVVKCKDYSPGKRVKKITKCPF
ncbi:MAG: hypothetical protein AB1502_01190 [Thermodesulfobacteriota bacterium]